MKILILSSYGEICGIARYTADLVGALTNAGHAVEVFPIDGPALDRRARHELVSHFDGFFARIPDHDAIVIQHEYALYAGSHHYEAAFDVPYRLLQRAAKTGKPVLIVFHNDPPGTARVPPAPQDRRGRTAWQGFVDTINRAPQIATMVHTPDARLRMIQAGLAAQKVCVHPLPVADLPPAAIPAPQRNDGQMRLAIFGFVNHYKGYELALRALALLPREISLVIAGGEHPRDNQKTTIAAIESFLATGVYPSGTLPPLAEGERKAAAEALQGRVTITGYLPDGDIARTLGETDIVLLPYMAGGPIQSAAAGWALACRRPIVATDVETFSIIAAERPCMHLVAADSPEALAAGIRRVAGDPAYRKGLAREAGLYADAHSWARAADFVAARLAGLPRSAGWRRLFAQSLPWRASAAMRGT